MHLVFLNQYYPPDVAPTGVMLADLVEGLVRDGHEVTVLCAAGGYGGEEIEDRGSEMEDGGSNGCGTKAGPSAIHNPQSTIHHLRSTIRIVRIGTTRFGRASFVGKLLDYLSYYIGVTWRLLWMRPRADRIVALTTPPYLSVLARVMSRVHGGDHGHWVMDLYPDVMRSHGILRAGGVVDRGLMWLAGFGFGGRRVAVLMTLGPDMAERVGVYAGEGVDVLWVPLWGTAPEPGGGALSDRELRLLRGWSDDELVVMYSGNMGLGHSFSEVLEVAGRLDGECSTSNIQHSKFKIQNSKSLRFAFFGGGKRRAEVEDFVREHPEAPVELHDYVPSELLGVHLASADVHLASLLPEWTGCMVPSKLQGIFAAGRPMVFIGGADSSIGQWVAESGGGWVVAPGDVDGLLAAIAEAGDPAERLARGKAAQAYAALHFDRDRNVARIAGEILNFEC